MAEQITETSKHRFNRAFKRLLRNNAVSFGLSVFNELIIGHSALGFGQATMEATDAGMAVGLVPAASADRRGSHLKASKRRRWLYRLHVGAATLGGVEAARLLREGSAPNLGNLAVSGVVGLLNGHFIYHEMKHRRGEAHRSQPDMQMAYDDPLEVIQDERMGYPDADTFYQLNREGAIAIAKTNAVEAGGGVAGTLVQFGWEKGGAIATILSSLGVIGIMGRQLQTERSMLQLSSDVSAV